MKHVALLRGINVGGKNKLPMKDLAVLFEKAGCSDVATYIQSGNVVFNAKDPASVAAKIVKAIEKSAGLKVPVVVRSASDLSRIVAANPFVKSGAHEDTLHVVFLETKPDAAAVKALDQNRSPGDEFVVVGGDIYLMLTNGAGNTKITNAWLDAKLKTVSTGRNWRTVQKLLELTLD